MFELCVGSTRFRVEAVDVHNTQVLAMEVVLAKVLSEATSQCHIFGWFFWFVWLVCWSVCCVTGGQWWVHLALLCRRGTWRDLLWFIPVRCLLAMRVASSPFAKLRSPIFGCSSVFFFTSLSCFWRAAASSCLFNFMRQRPVHPTLFVESYVTRSSSVHLSATSSECESAECNRASASCRSCLFYEVLWRRRIMFDSVGGVSTKWHCVSCHARRHQETRVSSSVRMMWRLNHFAGSVWVCCLKCLSVVPESFPGEEVRERNHCLFSGGLHS